MSSIITELRLGVQIRAYVGEPFTVTGSLYYYVPPDPTRHPIPNATVYVYILMDSSIVKRYTVITSYYGDFILSPVLNEPGVYKLYAEFPGTNEYPPCTSSEFTVTVTYRTEEATPAVGTSTSPVFWIILIGALVVMLASLRSRLGEAVER